MKFSLGTSPDGLGCIKGNGLPRSVMQSVRSIVTANSSDDPHAKAKWSVSPFLQAYDEDTGRLLVEFWMGSSEDHQKYVDYINTQICKP